MVTYPTVVMAQTRFLVCVHCDHEIGYMTLAQGHDTSFVYRQQSCEILSRSNLAVRSYGPDTDFQYVCTVTLTLEIWPWVNVMTHPWVMDNNYVKYYPDPTWQWGVMARTQISSMCALWPWPWRYDLGSRSWHTCHRRASQDAIPFTVCLHATHICCIYTTRLYTLHTLIYILRHIET